MKIAAAAQGAVPAPAAAAQARSAAASTRMQLALGVLAVIALVAALYFARAFFVPLLIGILASYALRPLVDGLQAWRVPRVIAAALVLAVLVGAGSWVAYALRGEAVVMIEKLPDAARKLRQALNARQGGAPTALQNVQEAANELQAVAADAARKPGARAPAPPAPPPPSWLSDYAGKQSALLASVAAQTPIVLLLAYFLLASGDHFRRKLLRLIGPSLTRRKDTLRLLGEIDVQVQRQLFVTLATNVLIAVGTWLAFKAMGVEQAGIWGITAGVLHFVPYLGSVLVAIAAGTAGFLQFGTLLHALAVALVAMLIATAIGLVFMTALQSRFARVNASVLFIALLFFAWLWGVAGLLLCAPLVAIAKVICDRVESLQPVGELIGR
ncbi:MAG: AI-2E family transporter [Burkholderiales bacterium]